MDQEKIESLNLPEMHSTCKPKIIIAFQGKIIHTVHGPNTSELEDHIKKNVPYIWPDFDPIIIDHSSFNSFILLIQENWFVNICFFVVVLYL